MPTLWEQIEEPWRLLEAAGILEIERDSDSLPTRVALVDGAAAWQGELPNTIGAAGQPPTRVVTVRVLDASSARALALRGRTAMPECGFCKFMKAGPCGEAFILWEACVDAAREGGKDFVDECGKPTLALKACTDRHPEYYGALSDDRGDEEDNDGSPPPENASKV